MARAPFQVLVYPYHKVCDHRFEYALLKRSDAGYWLAIAGDGNEPRPTRLIKSSPIAMLGNT
jgi:hypothetical protein